MKRRTRAGKQSSGRNPWHLSGLCGVLALALCAPGQTILGEEESLAASALRGLSQQETPTEGWTLEGKQSDFRLASRQVASHVTDAETGLLGQGPWSHFVLEGFRLTQAVISHRLPKARVLDELSVSVPVRCDKPGVRLRLRVVAPQTQDPETGQPLRFYLLGPEYTRTGRWETLTLSDIPRLVNRQIFLLRAEHGPQVDPRGAYVDQVSLIVYLGKDRTELTVGAPALRGIVSVDSLVAQARPGHPDEPNASRPPGEKLSAVQHGEGTPPDRKPPTLLPDVPSPGTYSQGTNLHPQPGPVAGDFRGDILPPPPDQGDVGGQIPSYVGNSISSAGGIGSELSGVEGPRSQRQYPGFEGAPPQPPPQNVLGNPSITVDPAIPGRTSGEGPPLAEGQSGRTPGSGVGDSHLFNDGALARQGFPALEARTAQPSDPNSQRPQSFAGNPGPPRATPLPESPRLVGSTFWEGYRPLFPRLITWRGEPLLLLRQLGVNGIWHSGPATAELLTEAARVGLWVVPSPLPPGTSGSADAGFSPNDNALQPASPWMWSRILAWNLGHQQGRNSVPAIRELSDQLRTSLLRSDAATVCHVLDGTREISRLCDVVVFERPIWEEGLELADWAEWLRRRQELARPGTPFWCGIPVHLPPWVNEQLELAGLRQPAASQPSWEALRCATFLAIGTGAKGLVYTTAQPLDGIDPGSMGRRIVLQLLQLELEMIDPFLAAGTAGGHGVKSPPGFSATLLRTDRARLVTPLPEEIVPRSLGSRRHEGESLSWTIPGVPEAYRAYLLFPGGLRPLRHRRTAGGMMVELDRYIPGGHFLLTNEPSILSAMTERANQAGPTAVSLLRRLLQEELAELKPVALISSRLQSNMSTNRADLLGQIQAQVSRSEDYFRLGDYSQAWITATEALLLLRQVMGSASGSSSRFGGEAICSHPANWVGGHAQASEATSPQARFAAAQAGTILFAANFDDLGQLFETGWRTYQSPAEPAASQVLVSAQAAYRGQAGLEFVATPLPNTPPQSLLESPPIWILSPSVELRGPGWVFVSLWVNIPRRISGSVDGLVIADSFGGLPMGIRLKETAGWQKVELYRRIPPNKPLEVLIALTGYGQAFVDEMFVRFSADQPSD